MTKVKFVIFKKELVALFPKENATTYDDSIMSYAKIGQHGSASKGLMRCKKATKEQYIPLYLELLAIGYDDLLIMN